ncbi:MAG TPA: hypothetical protein VF026_16285 [Ktedonobacteraceae bacterium]
MSVLSYSNSTTLLSSEESRALRLAAFFTMTVTAFYPLLFLGAGFLILQLTGDFGIPDLSTRAGLAYAGRFPTAATIGSLADGFSHVAFFVTFVAVFAVLRRSFPVRATLIVVGAAWQLVVGFTKALTSVYIITSLGTLYLATPLSGRAAFLPVGTLAQGLRQGLQDMDTYGVIAVWLLLALLPAATGMPRLVRWLGVVMTIAILQPWWDFGFPLALLLAAVWAISLGLWLKRQAVTSSATPISTAVATPS